MATPNIIEHDAAHCYSVVVTSDDIDGLGHANNVRYLQWLEDAAWSHSVALGIDLSCFNELDRAMAARRHTLDYIAPCFEGDDIEVRTWIASNDMRVSMERRYQIVRPSDEVLLLSASTIWVCIAMSSGRPKRMPEKFKDCYKVT